MKEELRLTEWLAEYRDSLLQLLRKRIDEKRQE